MDLAYYVAWHSGIFSQQYERGKFPEYEKHSPRHKAKTARKMTDEQMKSNARAFVAAMGGVIKRRGE